jgi:hypothetical protein
LKGSRLPQRVAVDALAVSVRWVVPQCGLDAWAAFLMRDATHFLALRPRGANFALRHVIKIAQKFARRHRRLNEKRCAPLIFFARKS